MSDLMQTDFVRKTERERVVVQIPTHANVSALFEDYASLMRAMRDDPALAVSIDHCQRAARAWLAFIDAFGAMDS